MGWLPVGLRSREACSMQAGGLAWSCTGSPL